MTDAVADNSRINSSGSKVVTESGLFEYHLLEIGSETGNKDSSLRAGKLGKRSARRLKCLVDDLEKLALLRVHPHGLDGCDSEEVGVKFLEGLVQEVAALDCKAAGAIVVFVEVAVDVEARQC